VNKALFCLLALSGALLALGVPQPDQRSAAQRPSAAIAQPGAGSATVEENVLYGSMNGSLAAAGCLPDGRPSQRE
jgi:hypothetical protein